MSTVSALPHRALSTDPSYYRDRAAGMVATAEDGQWAAPGSMRSIDAALEILAHEHGYPDWANFLRHIEALAEGQAVEPFIAAFEAIRTDDKQKLGELLKDDRALAVSSGTNGNDLLGLAVSEGRLDMLAMLIGCGADINHGNRYGWTALHQAAYSNNVEAAQLLLAAGARAGTSARGEGGTPLVQPLFWGHREVADVLAAAAGTVPDNLRAAAGAGNLLLVERFLDDEALFDAMAGAQRGFYRPHSGFPLWSPAADRQEILNEALVWACKCGRNSVVRALARHGADINADPYRGTGLIWAAFKGRVETVDLLNEMGADLNRRAGFGGPQHGQGVTALHLAAQQGNDEVVRRLIDLKADPTLRDELYHSTPAGWAQHFEHDELSEYLQSCEFH